MLANEVPNVVSEEGFRSLIDEGYQAVVLCLAEVEKRHTQWSGRWIVRAVGGEGQTDRTLVTSRGHMRAREFKTTLGLISFLYELGYETVSIPLREGTRAVQARGPEPEPAGVDEAS